MKKIPTLLLFLLFGGNLMFAQEVPVKEKIGDAIAAYFELDRESIHAHFDKSIFFSNEEIFFKGYCFNKKQATPFFETTNVYAVLHDDAGKQISEQLLFSYLGAFSGAIKLGPQLKSGRYYVRFYTNWMNNFPEDESATFPVEIINENEQTAIEYDAPDYSKVNITFHPEGGTFVGGVINNLGVRVTDCDGKPIETREAKIVDSKGETGNNFLIGRTGCGKTYVTPNGSALKAVISIGGKDFEAVLPVASSGIALEVNNFVLPQKTIVKMRSDEKTLAKYSDKPLFLVVQQNNKSTIFEISLKTDTELIISNDNLHPGVNTVRVIDADMNELAQRLICEVPNDEQEFSFSHNKTGDGIKIIAHSNFPNADISVSVLPDLSGAASDSEITADFLVNAYLEKPTLKISHLFDNPTKAKRYELDLYLLNQESGKYTWRNILKEPGKPKYDFDIGLSIKGSINQSLPDPNKYRMQLSSPASLIEDYSEIDEKNGFLFTNLVFDDLAVFRFTLLKIPSVPVEMVFSHQVVNRKRPFNKPFVPLPQNCQPGRVVDLDLPQFGKEVIKLDNVEIAQKKKSELKYKNKLGNSGLRGYKIGDTDVATDLLTFIGNNGFNVSRNNGRVSITGRLRTTLSGQQSTPEIYLGGRRLLTPDELQDIYMGDVDEIYLNPHAIVASMNNNFGVIKIYMKEYGAKSTKTATKSMEIKEGFAAIEKLEAPVYMSTSDAGFQKYGLIQWLPTILTDATGGFTIDIPKTDVKIVRLQIQGFTPDGKLISTTKTISLQ